jgi:3-hydroxyisobutyrate dehydrogenase-like beta-hydroxyacid dehydrogenase
VSSTEHTENPTGLSRKLDKIQADHYTPSFQLSLMRKDLGLIPHAARRRGVELRLVQDAARWIEQADQQGPRRLRLLRRRGPDQGRTATG